MEFANLLVCFPLCRTHINAPQNQSLSASTNMVLNQMVVNALPKVFGAYIDLQPSGVFVRPMLVQEIVDGRGFDKEETGPNLQIPLFRQK